MAQNYKYHIFPLFLGLVSLASFFLAGVKAIYIFPACLLLAIVYQTAIFLYSSKETRQRILTVVAAAIMAGGFGLFLVGFVLPQINLGSGFEFPTKRAQGFTTSRGEHIIAVDHIDRIQVYDSDWKFIRGWQYESFGGVETLNDNDGQINVYSARADKRYIYDIDGDLVGSEPFDDYPPALAAHSVNIPGPFWKWLFVSPFVGWLIGAIGMGITGFVNREFLRNQLGWAQSWRHFTGSRTNS